VGAPALLCPDLGCNLIRHPDYIIAAHIAPAPQPSANDFADERLQRSGRGGDPSLKT
jgi:hypothetical protein